MQYNAMRDYLVLSIDDTVVQEFITKITILTTITTPITAIITVSVLYLCALCRDG